MFYIGTRAYNGARVVLPIALTCLQEVNKHQGKTTDVSDNTVEYKTRAEIMAGTGAEKIYLKESIDELIAPHMPEFINPDSPTAGYIYGGDQNEKG